MALSDSRTDRRPCWRRLGPRPPARPGPPSLTTDPLPCMPCSLPRWTEQVLLVAVVACSHAGVFPVRAAFPVSQAGRHPHLHFRGLLKLHTRYGLQGCSPTFPWALSRGFALVGFPARALASYPVLPTTPGVGPSPTGDLRRRGALRDFGFPVFSPVALDEFISS